MREGEFVHIGYCIGYLLGPGAKLTKYGEGSVALRVARLTSAQLAECILRTDFAVFCDRSGLARLRREAGYTSPQKSSRVAEGESDHSFELTMSGNFDD